MAQFKNVYKVELNKGTAPVVSLRQIYYGDVEANRIGAIVLLNGEEVTLSGSCSGTAILADGSTVAITGTVDGSQAYVELPAACYSVEGQIEVYVKLTVSGVTTTLIAAVGTVRLTETDTVIDPGTIIPSVAALIEDIDEAVDALEDAVATIPADYSALLATIAPTFSSSAAYTAGSYVWYSGTLYRFTADHAAGAWTGSDAAAAVIGADLTSLKSAFNHLDAIVTGENLVNSSSLYSNNNSKLTNNNDGTYSVGTGDYGTTIFGEQITLPVGTYWLYGVPYGKAFVSTSANTQNILAQNTTESPVQFTITESKNCYLGFREETSPSSAFTIAPFIKKDGLEQNFDKLSVKVDGIEGDVEDLASIVIKSASLQLISGAYIATNVNVGATIDITPVTNSGFKYLITPCKSGDKFTITATGGTAPKAWTLTDENYKKLSGATTDSVSGFTVTATEYGFLIVNSTTGANPSVTKTTELSSIVEDHEVRITKIEDDSEGITTVTNPHLLAWEIGNFASGGTIQRTSTSRMFTSCRVKSGSTIKAPSSGGVQIQYGYKIDDSQTALDYYQTYGYADITVEQDCTIFIGALYTNPVYLPNDSLLDNLQINLKVVGFKSKYSKKDDYEFGNPLQIYYEGQHTDETGWTNSTVDVDAIHAAFDALVTDANGFITKTDLGVAYSTYHMYQYDTVPVGNHSNGGIPLPKVAIICTQHGNEKMSTYAMHYLMYDLIHNATKNPVLSYLRSCCRISFIPIANPWGFINTSRLNENGVNLNRNFPTYNWDDYDDETSVIGGINYKGTSAASEEQTKLMIKFLRNNFDAVYAIDLHTNGENTVAWYEISTAIINADSDATSPNHAVQESYYLPSKVDTNRIKPWLDENYGTDLGNVFYGNVTYPEPDRPTAGQWIRESNNMIGITYEVLAGSKDGYLGNVLTKYAPATIKAAAEILGNYIISMLINCKEQ